MSTGLASAMLR